MSKMRFLLLPACLGIALCSYAAISKQSKKGPLEIDVVFETVKTKCRTACEAGIKKQVGVSINEKSSDQAKLFFRGCVSECACDALGKIDTWACPKGDCSKQ